MNAACIRAAVAAALIAAACLPARADGERIVFFDEDSRIGHGEIVFDASGGGMVQLKERWCSTWSGECKPMTLPLPVGARRMFARGLDVPRTLKLDRGVTITLNPLVGIDAELSVPSAVTGRPAMRRFAIARDTQMVPLPEDRAARTVELRTGAGGRATVRIADNATGAGASAPGAGSVLELSDGWCGRDAGVCPGVSMELFGDVLRRWVDGETSETEPFLNYQPFGDVTLHRSGDRLALQVAAKGSDGSAVEARFEGVQAGPAARVSDAAVSCERQREGVVGSVGYHLYRVSDGTCIGSLGWAVVPDPRASLRLAAGWCGRDDCPEMELSSGPFRADGQPSPVRFYEGQTNGPSLVVAWGRDGAPSMLRTGDTLLAVDIVPKDREPPARERVAKREPAPAGTGRRYALSDLPRPLGAYGLLAGVSDRSGIGSRGESACFLQPVAFVRGRILFKRLGAPKNGNPYHVKRYMECSRFEGGPTNCTLFEGTPDAPNPTGSNSGFDYTALGDGDFRMCPKGNAGQCSLLHACVREKGDITFDREFPSGGRLVDAMIATAAGDPPGYRYIDNRTIEIGE